MVASPSSLFVRVLIGRRSQFAKEDYYYRAILKRRSASTGRSRRHRNCEICVSVISGADIPRLWPDVSVLQKAFVLPFVPTRYLARKRVVDSRHEFCELKD